MNKPNSKLNYKLKLWVLQLNPITHNRICHWVIISNSMNSKWHIVLKHSTFGDVMAEINNIGIILLFCPPNVFFWIWMDHCLIDSDLILLMLLSLLQLKSGHCKSPFCIWYKIEKLRWDTKWLALDWSHRDWDFNLALHPGYSESEHKGKEQFEIKTKFKEFQA